MRLLSVSSLFLFGLAAVVTATPDTLQDGDDLNSGYNGEHHLDPNFVTSDRFGVEWTFRPELDYGFERFMAKPLVYTARNGRKVLIAAASSNTIYVLDARTGEVINKRQLRQPYEEPALPCGDLQPHNGILGTPVIDRKTGTLYVFAKGYRDDNPAGPFSSVFWAHAVDAITLEERPGFPTLIDGPASNDPQRYFVGGIHLQRPSLKLHNGVVYGAFGSGCWIAAVNGRSGEVIQRFVTQSGPEAPSVEGGFFAGGGGGSIWQAGTGFSTDRQDRLFVAVGDGRVFDHTFPAAEGREVGSILEGTILNLKVNRDGSLTPQDHFRLSKYSELGSSARDQGSGGLTILDPKYFSIPGVARKLAIAGGQSGVFNILNLDNLGGYRQGPNGTDNVIQTIPVPGTIPGLIYGNFGSYPGEGGYIYVKPVGLRSIYVYKFNRKGPEYFTLVATSEEPASTAVGSGSPVVTTNRGRPGTGILWVADINQGLTAYHAVPQNGTLVRIPIPAVGRPKFQRPVFYDSRVYLVTTDGYVVAYGRKPRDSEQPRRQPRWWRN
ncbi:hypothetical protein CC1G_00136 [Coprinopsis cinerea okayama7|uniref:Uncharacterized protein n=1 Tax=Coprinopsis cinerea (strain Okayama-7 / 130 / ATCC MYA-4618 / FGSC 9003) TaxID=240176 RepID=A8NWW3_COPC7|nr:hypothetical protein CC1G_00136 [Coprinopsis cinerea okayama7\|eukprot:XP_001837000.2 hypothetical protein CC1G_00136 [Coprinopsis cinerea okayama7\